MKRANAALMAAAMWFLAAQAWSGEARTTAGAGGGRAATASASYRGTTGFAHAESHDGPVSTARGVALAVDEQGVSLSVSNAVATRFGPAVATGFNLTIGTDGSVAHSQARVLADGPYGRAGVGGRTGRQVGYPAGAAAWGAGSSRGPGGVRVSASASSHRSHAVRVHKHKRVVRRVVVRKVARHSRPERRIYRLVRR